MSDGRKIYLLLMEKLDDRILPSRIEAQMAEGGLLVVDAMLVGCMIQIEGDDAAC